MPQYRYAYDESHKIVDVGDVPAERAHLTGTFTCISCENTLIAKTKGERKEKHVAHKVRVECSEETYLHRLAKQTFYDVYRRCLEDGDAFTIELTHRTVCTRYRRLLGTQCDIGECRKTYNLTRYFSGIRMESRDGQFIPDLLLSSHTSPDEAVYIEIAVTHFLSHEKRASDHRIIEIPVQDEASLDVIRRRHISEECASFINFDRVPASVPDAQCLCARQHFYCLLIYTSGKSFLESGTLEAITAVLAKRPEIRAYSSLLDTREWSQEPEPADVFKRLILRAYAQGFPVRNCLLCKYSGQNWNALLDNKAIFCKVKKEACTSNAAASCTMFRVRPTGSADG